MNFQLLMRFLSFSCFIMIQNLSLLYVWCLLFILLTTLVHAFDFGLTFSLI